MDPSSIYEERFLLSCMAEHHQAWSIPSPATDKSNYRENLFRYANIAVEFYNSNHQTNQFEVVNPLVYVTVDIGEADDLYVYGKEVYGEEEYTNYYHLSFIAKSKEDSFLLKLFFAEVSLSHNTAMAMKCMIVEPCNPVFVTGCVYGCLMDGVIYHPLHFRDGYDYSMSRSLSGRPREIYAKMLLHEAYVITSYEEKLNFEEMDELRMTTYGYVYERLEVYNEDYGAYFKPLEIVASVRFGFRVRHFGKSVWAHLIVKAINLDPKISKTSPQYFFLEHCLQLEDTTTCVMMGATYPSSAYLGSETSCCAVCCEHCPNIKFHPEGFMAGREGGIFADVLDKDRSRMVKAKLEQKDGDSSKIAREKFVEVLER